MKTVYIPFRDVMIREEIRHADHRQHMVAMKIPPEPQMVRGELVDANVSHSRGFDRLEDHVIVGVERAD